MISDFLIKDLNYHLNQAFGTFILAHNLPFGVGNFW